jgi:hypothetical protein
MVHNNGREFTPEVQASIANTCDVFLSLAIGDACPTTLLETTSWGMVAVCNDQSGYLENEPFLPLRLNDMKFNLEMLDYLQWIPEYQLREIAAKQREVVLAQHGWARFCDTVWTELEKWL